MEDHHSRAKFDSTFGFVMAAAGAAIGLGNVWGFPTQTAQNGGAAFVIVYLILAFLLGYPVLMAEFIIGRHTRSNPIRAYQRVPGGKPFVPVGVIGILTVGVVLSFYSIVAGWMMAHFLKPVFELIGAGQAAAWITARNTPDNMLLTSVFFLSTILIVLAGIKNGIEKWSKRFMPTLLIMILLLAVYVMTLDGALDGIKLYLIPDINKILDGRLLLSAMGQAFFSLSLGVGGMLVYASYLDKKENLVRIGIWVTLADVAVAFLAGLMVIPALFVAAQNGTDIFNEQGELISGPALIFQVLPELFTGMGSVGMPLAIVFFAFMTIAALTSSIAMLEVPVAAVTEHLSLTRKQATWITGGLSWAVSMIIILNQDWLFDLIVTVTTKYSQPFLGFMICIFAGWVFSRNAVLSEIKEGNPTAEHSWFMKVWPFFVKFVAPFLILLVFLHSLQA